MSQVVGIRREAGAFQIVYPPEHPEVVTLCGSTRFKDAFLSEQARLTDEGVIVLSVGRFGHMDGLDMGGEHKKKLDQLHLRKIDMSDCVHVINLKQAYCPVCETFCRDDLAIERSVGVVVNAPMVHSTCRSRAVMRPYVGESTAREIAYARSKSKKITYLVTPEGA